MTVPLPSAVLQPRPALPGADLATLRADTLPFVGEDVTVGVENEFQVAIEGRREQVDLPLTISGSRYYQNLVLRARRGDLPPAALADLDGFLDDRTNRIWENSWVRFPRSLLSAYAAATLAADLRADKSRANSPLRADAGQLQRDLERDRPRVEGAYRTAAEQRRKRRFEGLRLRAGGQPAGTQDVADGGDGFLVDTRASEGQEGGQGGSAHVLATK